MGSEFHLPAAVQQVFEELHAVLALLVRLDVHPGGETGQVHVLEMGCHREIQVGRVEFLVDLFVDGFLHCVGNHDFLLGVEFWFLTFAP